MSALVSPAQRQLSSTYPAQTDALPLLTASRRSRIVLESSASGSSSAPWAAEAAQSTIASETAGKSLLIIESGTSAMRRSGRLWHGGRSRDFFGHGVQPPAHLLLARAHLRGDVLAGRHDPLDRDGSMDSRRRCA